MAFSDRGRVEPRYRITSNLIIVIADRESIYVSDGRYTVRFVRWFTPRGFYRKHWVYLEEYLMRSTNPTLEGGRRIAERHGIEIVHATTLPDYNNTNFRRIN